MLFGCSVISSNENELPKFGQLFQYLINSFYVLKKSFLLVSFESAALKYPLCTESTFRCAEKCVNVGPTCITTLGAPVIVVGGMGGSGGAIGALGGGCKELHAPPLDRESASRISHAR